MSLFFSPNKDKLIKTAEKFIHRGNVEAAIGEYEKALELDQNDITVLIALGSLYIQVKRNKDAVAKFLHVAEHYCKNGQFSQALAIYKKASRLDPTNRSLVLTTANLSCKQGQVCEAAKYYAEIANVYKHEAKYSEALEMIKEAIKLDPTELHLQIELADILYSSGSIDEAHETYLSVGHGFHITGRPTESVRAFQKALSIKPTSKAALKALADFSLKQGNTNDALTMLNKLLYKTPDDIDLIVLLGRTYLSAKMLKEAEATFKQLLSLDPTRYEYLLEVARGFLEVDEFENVIAIIDYCVDLIIARRHKKKATSLLKDIIQKDPQNLAALQLLASIYKQVNEKRNLSTTLNAIVEVALQQGKQRVAKEALEQLITIAPKRKSYKQQLANLSAPLAQIDDLPNSLSNKAQATSGSGEYNLVEMSTDYSTELLEQMVSQNPELILARIRLLEDIVSQQPTYLEAQQQLKKSYIDAGLTDKAAATCLIVADLQKSAGNLVMSEEMYLEAYKLNPLLKQVEEPPLLAVAATAKYTPMNGGTKKTESVISFTDCLNSNLARINSFLEFQQLLNNEWNILSNSNYSIIKIKIDNWNNIDKTEEVSQDFCLDSIAGVLGEESKLYQVTSSYCNNGEFILLVRNISKQQANELAEQLRTKIEALWLPFPSSDSISWITVSVGLVHSPSSITTVDELISTVDRALTLATEIGGNQVVISPLSN